VKLTSFAYIQYIPIHSKICLQLNLNELGYFSTAYFGDRKHVTKAAFTSNVKSRC
jgi:hypothetical protein